MQLADRTGFSFLSLADGVVQIQLTEGAISLRVDELHEHDVFEIDTPNLAFSLLRPGNYRVEVHEGAATFVSVRSGAGEVVGGGRSFTMDSDQRAVFLGTQPLEAHPLEPDSTRLTATAEEPAASLLPIDSMARPESRTQASDRSGPGVEADLPHNRPNSARPIILPGNPPGDFPGDLPAKSPYEEGLERVHQRQTEKLLRRQELQRLRLEQKHLEKVQKGSLPGETPQLQRQHRKLEARQAMLRDQLTRMQQQEKHNLQIVEKLRHSRKRVTRP
jgi:hypothetical protein